MTEERRAEYTKLLASNLPMLRKACDMSQTKFAELIGINRSTLSLIEKKKDMSWALFVSSIAVFDFHPNVKKITEAIGINYDEINEFLSGNSGKGADEDENK